MLRISASLYLLLAATAVAQTIPSTGTTPSGFSGFDSTMESLMAEYNVPGATLSIVHGGKLVFAKGYGYADTTTQALVQPDSLFRVASDTKPHTAAAVLKLIERGQLSLNSLAFKDILNLQPLPGYSVDPRVYQITVQDLLDHMSGWYGENDGTGYDPLFDVDNIAQVAGTTPPADPTTIIRFMLGRPLDTDPGTYYSYSNFGYLVLGQIIATVSGESYESFVQSNVTGPLGFTRSLFGATLTTAPGEVTYYDYPGEALAPDIFPSGPPQVPWPYGGYSVEDNHANGGLVTTSQEMAAFVASINGSRGPAFFHTPVQGFPGYVPPSGPGYTWYFHGSLPGNNSSMAVLPDQTVYAWTTNTRPADSTNYFNDFDNQVQADIAAITSWPATDLFPQFTPGFLVLNATNYFPDAVAPDQFVTLYGQNLSSSTDIAQSLPLPINFDNVTVTIQDSTGAQIPSPIDYISPGQINFIAPSNVANGPATITVSSGGTTQFAYVQIDSVSPGLFTANASGSGAPAATAGLYGGSQTVAVPVYNCPAAYQCSPVPMSVGTGSQQLIVALYGTGVRNVSSLSAVSATLNGQSVPVLYAGAQGSYAGLDQINVQIPQSFAGSGNVPLVVTVDGRMTNTVTLDIQ